MIYIVLILISAIYLFLLFQNTLETRKLSITNKPILLSFCLLFFAMIVFFVDKSGIQNIKEYDNILGKHQQIRSNILTIKNNIPVLEEKLLNNPEYYEGWVMIAKSYLIINNIRASSEAYARAIDLKSDDREILEEYISSLRQLDSKSNKLKILETFDQLISLDSSNTSSYNMKLNYAIEINDSTLTKKILESIVSNPGIKNKEQYTIALSQMLDSSNSKILDVLLSDYLYTTLKKSANIFFILRKDDSNVPFAVKIITADSLNTRVEITSNDIMLKNNSMDIPENIFLLIKVNDEALVDDSMQEIYRSESINLNNQKTYTTD